jgi:hypothetical protein
MKNIDIDLTSSKEKSLEMQFQIFIGHTLEETEGILQKPYYFRVTKENGVNYMVTCDFVPERVNITLENGIITEINGLG